MNELIKSIVARFGGRISGSKEAITAQYYYEEVLSKICDKTEKQFFKTAIEAKFHSLKIFSIIYILGIILFSFSPIIATVISFVNTAVFIGHFVMYYDWLDFLYPQKEALNVSGTLYPSDEIKSTIIIAGHIDSVYEFKWWYKWKQVGAYFSVISGFLFPFQFLFFMVAICLVDINVNIPDWVNIGLAILLLLSPVLITFYDIHNKNIKVDGAIDNLSGIAIAYGVIKEFADKNSISLKHTAVQAVSFGCEEVGLKGSKAYAKKIKKEGNTQNTLLINVDSIKNDKLITLVTKEVHALKNYDKQLIKKMEQSFQETGTSYRKNSIDVGITDGISFVREHIPALTIIGIESDRLDSTYHTRLDTMGNLDPQGLDAVRNAIINFIVTHDNALNNDLRKVTNI